MKALRFIHSKVAFCIAVVICCAAVISCGKPMTNDEIIAETKKCKDAGMKAETFRRLDLEVYRIMCSE